MSRAGIALLALVVASPIAAQEAAGPTPVAVADRADALAPIRDAYRQGVVLERVELTVASSGAGPQRGEAIVAIRPGASPAIGLALGDDRPLRVFAEPGRLIAWRADDPSRLFVAPLSDPFGRAAIERVLPPLYLPQIALALGADDASILPDVGVANWSQGDGTLVGVSGSTSIVLRTSDLGRLSGFELRQDGIVRLRAIIRPVGLTPRGVALLEPPSLDGVLVETMADLGRAPGGVKPGERFGDMIGVDARDRPTTLRTIAGDAQRVVVLSLDAPPGDARARVLGALAEAELPRLATLLDATVVVVAVGDAGVADMLQRVVGHSGRSGRRVRTLAVEQIPRWLDDALSAEVVAFAVEGSSWTLEGVHIVGDADPDGSQMAPQDPSRWDRDGLSAVLDASIAPRPLSARIARAIGAAGRS